MSMKKTYQQDEFEPEVIKGSTVAPTVLKSQRIAGQTTWQTGDIEQYLLKMKRVS